MGKYCDFASQTPLVRPKSEIYTPKGDDEHPRVFHEVHKYNYKMVMLWEIKRITITKKGLLS